MGERRGERLVSLKDRSPLTIGRFRTVRRLAVSMLALDDRGFVTQASVWATNPRSWILCSGCSVSIVCELDGIH